MIHVILAGSHIDSSLQILAILYGPKNLPIEFEDFRAEVWEELGVYDDDTYNYAQDKLKRYAKEKLKVEKPNWHMTWLWIDYLIKQGFTLQQFNDEHWES